MSWIRRKTEKGAVQYICPHCHDYHEFREDFGGRTFSENYIFCRRCGARNGTGNAPTLTPPNEPLTLEQLREMDGEPVWVVPRGTHEKDEPMWCVLESPMALIPGVDYWSWDFDGYAETWIAYRRPPERQEDT